MSQRFEHRSMPQVDDFGRKFMWFQTRFQSVVLKRNEILEAVDDYGTGTLESYEFHCDSRNMQLVVELYTNNGTKYSTQQNYAPQDLLSYGWGLTPGDVALVGGISPDRHGTPNGVHPWLARYKDTTEDDYRGKNGRWYTIAYTPNNPPMYTKRFKVSVKNLENERTIRDLIVTRKVYSTTENTAD